MNDWDRENVKFLLGADAETLKDWYDHVDEDDHQYASEILEAYNQELKLKLSMYECEATTEIVDAAKYLKRFRL